MVKGHKWERITDRLEHLIRLKTFPVAFKLLKKKERLDQMPFLQRPEHRVTLSQLISLARSFDRTMGADAHDFVSPECSSILGLTDLPDVYRDGTIRSVIWTKKREDGKKCEDAICRLPKGKYEAVVMAPLVHAVFEPDIVLVYANPAQMMLLINALQFEAYEVMAFSCVGESSCADAVSRCYLTGKPSLTIPSYEERCCGHNQDDELMMAVPAGQMDKALSGMEALFQRGIRYPIRFAGLEQDPATALTLTSPYIQDLETIRGQDNRLLVGVTGGIASGKTTVARLMEDLGVAHIDYDLLARQVVEPGKAAWQDILSCFGSEVLNADQSLDRKKLGSIVFQDMEKRKKLESFTHPRIHDEFVKQVDEIAKKSPGSIIQVSVPLMIEQNLQHMFHKLVVVHVSEEQQLERLMARDRISESAACAILNAQLSIEEKVGYADFVIYNGGSIEETENQVKALLHKLKDIRREMTGKK